MSELDIISEEIINAMYAAQFINNIHLLKGIYSAHSVRQQAISMLLAWVSIWQIYHLILLMQSSLALVAYDTLLSFSQEITYIWKRKKSMITILYLFIRYSIIFNMFIRVFHLSNMHITIAVSKYIIYLNISL